MTKVWRGFIALSNKKQALQKFKGVADEQLLPLAEAVKLDSYGGVLDSNVALLDFDDKNQAEIAYKMVKDNGLACIIVKTTRGYHFIFKDDGDFPKATVGQRLACGLRCDIKLGNKNGYEVLKLNNVDRPIVQECEGELSTAPPWFRPVDSDVDLLGMGEGDGRNETMFAYMMTLTNKGFTADECKETAEAINEYVFKTPMDRSEFDTVTRDEAFVLKTPVFKDKHGHFLHNEFADWLLEHDHIIKISGMLHVYKDGIYVRGEKAVKRKLIEYIPDLPEAKRKEVYEYLDLVINYDTPVADARYIPFQNGVFDVVDKELLPFSPDIVITNIIPHDYNPKANNKLVIKTLGKLACGNKDIMNLLGELIGYCFWRRNELGASFFLLGDKSNGKSTFISMLNYLLGEQNISALDLADFNKDFRLQEMFGKLANLGDDIGEDFIADMSLFKKICTGNALTVAAKYENPFILRPYTKLIFSANVMPRLNDKTGAVLRRIVPIKFNATFSKNDADYDPYIIYKLNTEEGAQTLINIGLQGLDRILANKQFSTYTGMKDELQYIAKTNNPLVEWLSEYGEDMVENHSVAGVYNDYTQWCFDCQLKPLSRTSWSIQVQKQCGVKPQSTKDPVKGTTVILFVKV